MKQKSIVIPCISPDESDSVKSLTSQNVRTIAELEAAAKSNVSITDQIANFIAKFCGSITFVWVHVIWFSAWIILNSYFISFDKFPFTFLTLVVSLEAIFLSTFILISQNHDSKASEKRNQLDLQINLLTEQENTKILTMLEEIAKKVGVEVSNDSIVRVLKKATDPKELIEEIDAAARNNEVQK